MEVDNDNKKTIARKIMTTSVRKGSDCYADDDQHHPAVQLPTGALVVLALCMTLHSYTLVNLFPYVGLMVKHLLTLETTNEAGFYAGYVAGSFTLGRFLSSYALGHASDAYGRKPVIVLALISIMVFSLSFGLSTTYTSALLSRVLLGLFNGIKPALRTSMREICGPEHVVIGLTYLTGCKGASLVLGTGIGGLLAQPAMNYPSLFSETGLFGRYPFLLPNLAGSCFALVLIPVVIFYFPETKDFDERGARRDSSTENRATVGRSLGGLLENQPCTYHSLDAATSVTAQHEGFDAGGRPSRQQCETEKTFLNTGGSNSASNIAGDDGCCGEHLVTCHAIDDDGLEPGLRGPHGIISSPNAKRPNQNARSKDDKVEPGLCGRDGILASPNVKTVLLLAVVFQIMYVGFEEVYPLWALSTPAVGGLGWGSMEIGKVLIVTGSILVVNQLVIFPTVIKVVGIVTYQRIGCIVCALALVSIPSATFFSWNKPSLHVFSVASTTIVNSGLSSFNLALVVASTSMVPANMRAKLSGLFGMAESLGKIIGPAGYATTFAWSISPSAYIWVDYHFVFYASAFAMVGMIAVGWKSLTLENLMGPAKGGDAGVLVDVVDKDHASFGSLSGVRHGERG